MSTDKPITEEEVKATIKCIHKMWYDGTWMSSPEGTINMHRHLAHLFNYAGITETLCENNPDEMSPDEFLEAARKKL